MLQVIDSTCVHGYEPEDRVFESLRAHQITPNKSVTYGQIWIWHLCVQNRTVPRTVPTQRDPGLFHCGTCVVFLRVHVPFRDRHVAVPGEVGERPRVHEGSPPRQAGVPERDNGKCASFASVQAWACWPCRLDGSMWPLFVGAEKIHGPSVCARRISRIDCARWERGMRRRALSVLP
jgi:hypothetical protein